MADKNYLPLIRPQNKKKTRKLPNVKHYVRQKLNIYLTKLSEKFQLPENNIYA